jgi:ABC-2 type transport system permease protein
VLDNVRAVLYKEWKELVAQRGNLGIRGGGLSLLFIVAVFSIAPPLRLVGAGWIESPTLLVMCGWLPFMLAATSAADSFAGERERRTLETLLATPLLDRAILLGKIVCSVVYAFGVNLLVLVLQLIALNLAHGGEDLLLFRGVFGWGSLLLSLLGAGLAATGGALISLRARSVQQAHRTLSFCGVLLPLALSLAGGLLPVEWRVLMARTAAELGIGGVVLAVSAVLAAVEILLFVVASGRFQRGRLIAD